jgi:hypothetical protein
MHMQNFIDTNLKYVIFSFASFHYISQKERKKERKKKPCYETTLNIFCGYPVEAYF